ncbi:MAG: hypothetical protein IJE68_03970 [Clostridia bacterium]|nr:hypothetical protein [Clostridia bacterium]
MRKRNCWLQIVALLLCGILLTACHSTPTPQYSKPEENNYGNQAVYECKLEFSSRTVMSNATAGNTYYCTAVDSLTNVQYIVTGSSQIDGGMSITPRIDSDGNPLIGEQECELKFSQKTVISKATVGSTYYCTAVDTLTNVQYLVITSSQIDGGISITPRVNSDGSPLIGEQECKLKFSQRTVMSKATVGSTYYCTAVDSLTDVQYIMMSSSQISGGMSITPRIASDGKPLTEEQECELEFSPKTVMAKARVGSTYYCIAVDTFTNVQYLVMTSSQIDSGMSITPRMDSEGNHLIGEQECELEFSQKTVIAKARVGGTYYCTAVDAFTNVQYLVMTSSQIDGGMSIILLIDSSGSHLLAN